MVNEYPIVVLLVVKSETCILTLILIETPKFWSFANRADLDQTAQELPDQGLLCLTVISEEYFQKYNIDKKYRF